MQLAGQTLAHLPHPTQSASATAAWQPRHTFTALRGHTLMQVPHATQYFLSITATRFDITLFSISHHP
jgi:hypothetical protein